MVAFSLVSPYFCKLKWIKTPSCTQGCNLRQPYGRVVTGTCTMVTLLCPYTQLQFQKHISQTNFLKALTYMWPMMNINMAKGWRTCLNTNTVSVWNTQRSASLMLLSYIIIISNLSDDRSTASFKWEYPRLSSRSSTNFLRLLPHLLVCPFVFPSITCFRRQFLRKMWPIQLAFRFLVSCRIFLCSLTHSK
jgi:hypothetical protein